MNSSAFAQCFEGQNSPSTRRFCAISGDVEKPKPKLATSIQEFININSRFDSPRNAFVRDLNGWLRIRAKALEKQFIQAQTNPSNPSEGSKQNFISSLLGVDFTKVIDPLANIVSSPTSTLPTLPSSKASFAKFCSSIVTSLPSSSHQPSIHSFVPTTTQIFRAHKQDSKNFDLVIATVNANTQRSPHFTFVKFKAQCHSPLSTSSSILSTISGATDITDSERLAEVIVTSAIKSGQYVLYSVPLSDMTSSVDEWLALRMNANPSTLRQFLRPDSLRIISLADIAIDFGLSKTSNDTENANQLPKRPGTLPSSRTDPHKFLRALERHFFNHFLIASPAAAGDDFDSLLIFNDVVAAGEPFLIFLDCGLHIQQETQLFGGSRRYAAVLGLWEEAQNLCLQTTSKKRSISHAFANGRFAFVSLSKDSNGQSYQDRRYYELKSDASQGE
jgi:hypothetical protein